jgi:ABC-type transport system involved in multi-copper enzyme maturation permease subunit
MRLVAAEILKLRRRWATYVVLGVLVGLMTLIFLLVTISPGGTLAIRFPAAYGFINEFVFGLGSLMAVVYAAAVAGADWSWGILGVVVARGESRTRYILAKAIGLGIVLAVGVLIAYGSGILLTLLGGAMSGTSVGDPFARGGTEDLLTSLGYGTLVLFERAAIGFAVALVLRSQMAGVIVGIVLYIGEAILTAIMTVITLGPSFGGEVTGGFTPRGPEWFQYLPFTIGDSVIGAAVESPTTTDPDLAQFLLRPVPIEQALLAVALYLVAAVAVGALWVRRAQLTGSAG